MSKDDRDKLEIEINRYLDGEISDDDFEKFLESRPEDFDVDSFKSLKTRVEKIEELYLQLEEPVVPDGYWETFADRVDARLGERGKSSVWEKILGILLPTRWPKVTYGYAGALASVLLVFVIGKTIMESGADKYSPASYQTPVIVEKPAAEPAKDDLDISDEAETKRVELPSDVSMLKPVGDGKVEIDREKKSDTDEFTADDSQIEAESPPRGKAKSKGAATEITSVVAVPEANLSDIQIESDDLDESDVAAQVDIVPNAMQMPELTTEGSDPQIVVGAPTPVPPVETGDRVLQELDNMTPDGNRGFKTASALQSSLKSAVGTDGEIGGETSVWKYDNWNLEDLRTRLKFYEAIVDDSAFSSEAFSEYAEIRSSVAILTRDSIDIYDAVNTIDTLLNYNRRIDRPTWMQRREHIQSLRNSMINP